MGRRTQRERGADARGEDDLLRRIARALARGGGRSERRLRLGMGDDAALFAARKGYETILTCDWFLEGTHFLRELHPADAVGWKCLARAASDIAAMGGEPRCFLLSLAVPKTHTGRWLDEFLGGLHRAARRFGCAAAGGDTTRQDRILINVTVLGEVRAGRAVLRSGARAGDLIFVSGRLGEAELGLRLLRSMAARPGNPLARKHLYPEPRLALGRWLTERRMATAMMDISDGLSTDLRRLCAASGVGARIEVGKLPVVGAESGLGARGFDALRLALDGGDDYELLFTVPPGKAGRIHDSKLPARVTCIGTITRDRKVLLIQADGRERVIVPGGWDAFRDRQ